MNKALAWIKANPISVVSFALMFASLGAIGYFIFFANPALRASAAEQPGRDLNQLDRYLRQSLEVPPANADDPPETLRNVTINAATVEVLDGIYGDLTRESKDIFDAALRVNRAGKQPMIDALFPDTPSGLGFSARNRYLELLAALAGDADRAAGAAQRAGLPGWPYLNAGRPMTAEELQRELDVQRASLNAGTSQTDLNDAQRQQQFAEQQRELVNQLLRHAAGLNVYADPDLGNPPRQINPDFPLQVASLGRSTASPTPSQLWEAQLELWVLQDLIAAIALANDVPDQREHRNVNGQPVPSSVLNAPVKRLIRAEVLPGYVGLHNAGGVNALGGGPRVGDASYGPPAGGMTDRAREEPLSENFVFSPTGRSSNSLYDVRHARLLLHADYQRLPELFNALGSVNLMTVLNARVTALDEYELLGQRYMYGQGDVVELELIIETLWLREWTAPLMPEAVKVDVGLAEPSEGVAPGGGFGGGGGGWQPGVNDSRYNPGDPRRR
ncbi:MAG: hypothetical protein AAF800_07900 [Planctomycetota bacterium]